TPRAHSPLCQLVKFLGVEVDDSGIVRRRGFEGDHVEGISCAEEVMPAVRHYLVHLWVLMKALVDGYEIPGKLEHRWRLIDGIDGSQLVVGACGTDRGSGADANDGSGF